MSKKTTEFGAWSSQSAALFRAARTGHMPTALDRERVRDGLARRLAAGAVAPAAGEAAQDAREAAAPRSSEPTPPPAGSSVGGAGLGKLAKIGVGLACVVVGAVAFMRGGREEPRSPVANRPAAHATASSAASAARVPGPAAAAERAPAVVAENDPGRVVASERGPVRPARPAAMAARTRSAASQPTASVLAAEGSQPRGPQLPTGGASNAQPSFADAAKAEAARPALAGSATAPLLHGGASPQQAMEDSDLGRAELAFMARIHAAMLESKANVVLALCAEHARRWPEGKFAQEREGLRAIAACSSRASDAAARARRFLAHHPRSSLAPRVRDECGALLSIASE